MLETKSTNTALNVRVKQLFENDHNHGKLYCLKQGHILRLTLANSLVHKRVRLFSNLPPSKAAKSSFIRAKYYEYSWKTTDDDDDVASINKNDDFNKFIDLECDRAGSYEFYFTLDGTDSLKSSKGGSEFLVDPNLSLSNGQHVDLDSLQMQTSLTKLLGPLDEWKSRLLVTQQSGYNMIHFTPIQELSGESDSSYCLRDHLKLMSHCNSNGKFGIDDLKTVIDSLYVDWNMFSICDLVYNHMSNDAEFLKTCPNATYNLVNSPHLIPAFVLDRIFAHVTLDIQNEKYLSSRGIPPKNIQDNHLETLRHILRHEVVPSYKLEEFYVLNIDETVQKIRQLGNSIKSSPSNAHSNSNNDKDRWKSLKVVQDPKYRRLKSTVDFELVGKILSAESDLEWAYDRFRSELNRLNDQIKATIYSYLDEAVKNIIANAHYHFLADDGPKWSSVSREQPIVPQYFYFPFADENVNANEKCAFETKFAERIQAHNGWVMNDDVLKSFASEDSMVYFRRQLIPWSDCVKLRFGNDPGDNPELWTYMAEYTRQTARIFHGVRLDNCHSTPIHVAQYFMDVAREIRPNLFVIAELFTNDARTDNMFVTKLGITSLIREGMSAWNANELGRLVHRYGGEPVGSFCQHAFRPLEDGVAHAVFFDITHDNKSLIQVRSVYDALPSSSLILMSGCAVGSTRGFDELVPIYIDVVKERRLYSKLNDEISKVDLNSGIIKAKSLLNKLHFEMGLNGFSQIYVDQFDADTTVVTRHNPHTHESIILIARTSFTNPSPSTFQSLHKPLTIPSKIQSIMLEAHLVADSTAGGDEYKPNPSYVNGLKNYRLITSENLKNASSSKFIDRIDYNGNESHVHFKYFPPGALMVFNVVMNDEAAACLPNLRNSIKDQRAVNSIIDKLSFDELNILLYRCSEEENSDLISASSYNIANHGPLTYCGLQGFMNVLERERLSNNLGHPFFENLRNGNWMLDYITTRLVKYYEQEPEKRSTLLELSKWLNVNLFNHLKKLPRYLIPMYFDLIITDLYAKSIERAWSLMSPPPLVANKKKSGASSFNLKRASSFLRLLSLGSVCLNGHIKSALLPNTISSDNNNSSSLMLSLSAGLPHFSTTIFRNWGRDTFISLKGLLLLTNRFSDARTLILSYASTLRHGLIPNLLGEGKCARYNCRDSVWWWLKAIVDYIELAPDGYDILNAEVFRLYPSDDSEYPSEQDFKNRSPSKHVQKLSEIIQEALTKHVNGLKFRERNAGSSIDEHMRSDGFNMEIGVNLETGFVYGGNQFNCGTWMDKMGSSSKADNKGLPSTPRDGSAVELIGLSRFVLEWLRKSYTNKKYPYDGVELTKATAAKQTFTWIDWASRIDMNFEKYYWIDSASNQSMHINKRNIYKDTLGSQLPWTDYQLRPNFLIALCLAPQMVNKNNARQAIEQVRRLLMNDPGTLGIKTLDESDYNYCGYYDNSNDSADKRVANGANYHQGPEWLWPVGYYLMANLIYFSDDHDDDSRSRALSLVKEHLGKLNECMQSNDWKSLPELTNKNGERCPFSCDAQAWSLATVLEVFYKLASI